MALSLDRLTVKALYSTNNHLKQDEKSYIWGFTTVVLLSLSGVLSFIFFQGWFEDRLNETLYKHTYQFFLLVVLGVDASSDASIDDAFIYSAPISLPLIFTGYGPLPAVVATDSQTGNWDAAGQTRTVILSDDSTAQEMLNSYKRPNQFSYTVDSFTGLLRFLVESAYGTWHFTSAGDKTRISWTYTFTPKSALLLPVVSFIAKVLWRGYMRKALRLAIENLDEQEGIQQKN